MPTQSTADFVIQQLGGLTETAKALGITVPSVYTWQETGKVPPRRWKQVLALFKKRKLPLTIEQLMGEPVGLAK